MEELALQAERQLGVRLHKAQIRALEHYERELLDWNTRFNLTAIRNSKEIRTKHFLDSLTCVLAMRDTTLDYLIDIGSGAGFPGIPLKIVFPKMRVTLVESVGKKAEFCRHVVRTLNLDGVEVLQERAETLGQSLEHREKYDWAVARAVAILPVLVEFLLPLVRVGGNMVAMKGESGPAEAHSAENAIRLLGGQLRQLMPLTLPGVAEERYLVVVSKTATTPTAYPRRVGVPAKYPLQ